MKAKSILSVIALTAAASLGYAGWTYAGEHVKQHRAESDASQAKLTLQQAIVIAEALGDGGVRKVEWKPDAAVYEVKLATADGQRREVRVEAYGGRVIED